MASIRRIVHLAEETTQPSLSHHDCWMISGLTQNQSDAVYPDTASGGYKSKDCGKYAPTAVISTSYGYNEADLSPAYEQRQCNE